jgi:hypothetical protein
MLTQIKANASYGKLLFLPVLTDDASGFTVRNVDGLGPVRAEIVTSTFAMLDGSNYQASSVDNRNIVITVGLEPYHGSLTVKDLRDKIYSVFMPKNKVDLAFYDHSLANNQTKEYLTSGYVESCEPNIFSQDPEIVISIVCPDPFFYDPTETLYQGTTTQTTDMADVNYPGSSDNGFHLRMTITDPAVNQIVVYRMLPSGLVETFTVKYSQFQAGDVLDISTTHKSKIITVTRSNIKFSILHAVDPVSTWLELAPGTNKFRVYTNVGALAYDLRYTVRHGGL